MTVTVIIWISDLSQHTILFLCYLQEVFNNCSENMSVHQVHTQDCVYHISNQFPICQNTPLHTVLSTVTVSWCLKCGQA